MAAGEHSQQSPVAFDLKLGYSMEGEKTSVVYNDVAFIHISTKDTMIGECLVRGIIVIASVLENGIIIIDIANNNQLPIVVHRKSTNHDLYKKSCVSIEWMTMEEIFDMIEIIELLSTVDLLVAEPDEVWKMYPSLQI